MNHQNCTSQLEQPNAGKPVAGPALTFPFRPVLLPPMEQDPVRNLDDKAGAASTPDVAPAGSFGQHHVDLKAFKGRGARRRKMKAQAAVDKVHEDMRRLAAATKSIKGKSFYLAVHTRGGTGQLSLRWRRAGTTNTSHIAWNELDDFMAPLPRDLVRWYQTVNDMAVVLNVQEKHNRAVLRHTVEYMRSQGIRGV